MAEALEQQSGNKLSAALQNTWGGRGYVKEETLTQLRQNLEFRQFEEDYPWLVKMQVWCPLMDEADGVQRSSDEKLRNVYYKGYYTETLCRAIQEAEAAAKAICEGQGIPWRPTLLHMLQLTTDTMLTVVRKRMNMSQVLISEYGSSYPCKL